MRKKTALPTPKHPTRSSSQPSGLIAKSQTPRRWAEDTSEGIGHWASVTSHGEERSRSGAIL
jgi:hypothetical protein